MAKYRKKPIIVEATQFFSDKKPWPAGVLWARPCPDIKITNAPWIKTLEGWHKVSNGDWIITDIKGEQYPCKPDIFEQTYEKVED